MRLDWCEFVPHGGDILSEFYHLRRTAIKDIAAYLGFLAGFIGSAPFGWSMLAAKLESGSFVTGLWYFFGIVTAAGIFTGIAGLGVGYTTGLVWEQVHRYRRRSRAALSQSPDRSMTPTVPPPVSAEQPVLKLVGAATDTLPDLSGRRLNSVRFLESGVELDFVSIRVAIGSAAIISSGIQRMRYPDSGSRDAICALIGARVERLRVISGERIEITFDNGYDLTVPRTAMQVA